MTVLHFARPAILKPERLKAHVEPNGDVVLRLSGTPEYVIAAELAERTLEQLLGRVRRARYRALGLPAELPARVTKERIVCHRCRDGALVGHGGCRRNRGHAGDCKDSGGSYTPAICTHQGKGRTAIYDTANPGDDHVVCAHCYRRTGDKAP